MWTASIFVVANRESTVARSLTDEAELYPTAPKAARTLRGERAGAVHGGVRSVMADVEELIASLEREHAKAIAARDIDKCSSLLSEEYSLVEAVAKEPLQVVLRNIWIDRVKNGEFAAVSVDDVIVADHGTAAVAMVLFSHGEAGTQRFQSVATDVWRQESAGWRLVQRHLSRCSSDSHE
jgi:ketosteroid isomerase-like protein